MNSSISLRRRRFVGERDVVADERLDDSQARLRFQDALRLHEGDQLLEAIGLDLLHLDVVIVQAETLPMMFDAVEQGVPGLFLDPRVDDLFRGDFIRVTGQLFEDEFREGLEAVGLGIELGHFFPGGFQPGPVFDGLVLQVFPSLFAELFFRVRRIAEELVLPFFARLQDLDLIGQFEDLAARSVELDLVVEDRFLQVGRARAFHCASALAALCVPPVGRMISTRPSPPAGRMTML